MGARSSRPLRSIAVLVGLLSLAVGGGASACAGGDGKSGGESGMGPQVDVRFKAGTQLDDPARLLPASLRASVVSVAPLVNPEAAGRLNAERMARWFRLELAPGTAVAEFVPALAALDVVEVAERVPEPAPDP
jgi:hypothetical protein